MLKLIECPRDAMQGLTRFIPTQDKIEYIQALLDIGFDILDCASFVSPKAVPQMSDSEEVIKSLDLSQTTTELLAICLNERGAAQALSLDKIKYIGYPFSISPTFQRLNGNSTITDSFERLTNILKMANEAKISLNVYISMGFGNRYGDEYSLDLLCEWVKKIADIGVNTFSISDTIGIADDKIIGEVFQRLYQEFSKDIEFGAHLHSLPYDWIEKIKAAHDFGCLRFDSAIGGLGGCPMAEEDLVGNIATENIVNYFKNEIKPSFNYKAFNKATLIAHKFLIS
ncbi:MAG: hydroxymethylglutaryl-CoA lyase [Chitinophagales bacterium]|jgi:hydroxymethylglutaryl-CoA lyase|nr:hydroxymethylglutaryl-CoA lyase [Chitinophagales bacterium]